MVKVQTQCEDTEKNVASEVKRRAEELTNQLINAAHLKILLFLNSGLFSLHYL